MTTRPEGAAPVAIIPLPGPRPPPTIALSSESLRAAIDRELVMVPLSTDDASPELRFEALALAQLLAHAVENDHDLNPLGLAYQSGFYRDMTEASSALMSAHPDMPSQLAKRYTRYVLGGHYRGTEVDLWLMDRDRGTVHRRRAEVDRPRLFAPRLAVAALLADAEAGPGELTRADMTWYEDLPGDALAWVGRALFALDFEDKPRAIVEEAERHAPMSYTMAVIAAREAFWREGDCTAAAIARYVHMTSLHRNTPLLISTQLLSCEVGRELGHDIPPIPTWSKRSDATCRIGAKALTTIGAGRGSLRGGREIGRQRGFVTGLGGVYRGDTCDAGFAMSGMSEDVSVPPWTRAALELEAGFYAYSQSDQREARRWFRRARETARTGEGPHCIQELFGAEATLALADLDVELGYSADVERDLDSAEAIAGRCFDTRMLGRIANTRGILAQQASAMDQALKWFERAHELFAKLGDEMNLAVTRTNLGVTWLHLGRTDKAIPMLEEALAGKERVRSKGGVAVLHENLGVAELARGDGERAEAHFKLALEHVTDNQTRATLLVQMARLALSRGDREAARRHMDEASEASTRVHARVLRAVIEQVEASMASDEGRFTDALRDFHSALAIRRSLGDRMGEGITLTLLMQVALRMEKPDLAILYGKLAVAAHEEVRATAKAIDKDTAREFLASRAETYRALADLLVRGGRLIEAERVVALLKEDEVSVWTRGAAASSSDKGLPLTTVERALESRYREVADRVMAIGREHAELAQKATLTSAEKTRLDELRKGLEAANAAFLGFLESLGKEGGRLAKSRTLESLREDVGIAADLGDLGPGHVAVYTLVAEEALHLIVVSADAQVARSVRYSQGALDDLIASFRELLQDPSSNPLPIAQALYDLVLRPIEKDLMAAGAKTVLWSLDRTLRYLPIGALHDGERYAIERWSHAVFTPASHARLKDVPGEWRVLGLGVTRAHPPFSPLPAVGKELAAIVGTGKDRLPGVVALDSDFTRDRLVTELGRRYPVVHLASHFAFRPGDKDNSFLLLGDGQKLSVTDLERLPNLFAGVDLLTLSACDTATGDLPGDGTEVESFAVLAQRKGARAVFATLWPVADESTGWLMKRFYAQKKVPKVQALRAAQLDLLSGKADPGWRHPYHWAPFIVIGNTR